MAWRYACNALFPIGALVKWLGDMHAMLCFQLDRWLNGLAICMQCFVSNWSVG